MLTAAILSSERMCSLGIKIFKYQVDYVPSQANTCETNENMLFATQWKEVRSGNVIAFRASIVNKSTRLPVCVKFDKYSLNVNNIASNE